MDINKLTEELIFVGKIKKLSWFNESLINKRWFVDLIIDIANKKNTTLRNILYSLFPIVEYLHSTKCKNNDTVFSSYQKWAKFIKGNSDIIINLAANFSTQGNIPQRAAIIIDYLNHQNITKEGNNIIIELGCSYGLLGIVFENTNKLFVDNNCKLAKEYFWLKKMPMINPKIKFNYFGYEINIPPKKFVPFCVWDKNKRKKVNKFINNFLLEGIIFGQSIESFLETNNLLSTSPIIIITSFVLYHFPNPEFIINSLLRKIKSNIHWIDLSRNKNLPLIFNNHKHCRPNWIYLSYNGVPVAEIRNGSDDCPNWEYI